MYKGDDMKIIKYILLGILQGLTEPLPISSSGHLTLFRNLFNTELFADLNFEIFVNFGSFIAILIIFWKDIVKLVTAFFGYIFNKEKRAIYQNDFKYCWLVVVATIPAGICGLLLKDKIESALGTPRVLGIAFLITALSLFVVRNIKGQKEDKDITLKDAIAIGLLQAVALCPGISRSGTVLVGCLLCGLKRDTALKFTFILYFPVSIASFGLGAIDLVQAGNLSAVIVPYLAGMAAAGIVTYFAYQWLSDWVKKGKLWKFSIYALFLAIFIFIYFR